MLIALPVFADYTIILKNGREFVVEDYKESEGKVKFYKGGGIIELDKNNIESIKKVKSSKAYEESSDSQPGPKDSSQSPAISGKEAPGNDIGSRLREIIKKKEALMPERDKLSEEKKKLDEDLSKASMFMSVDKAKDFEKRAADIEEKIRKFNEEIKKLNDEESRLVKEAEGKQK